MRSRLDLNGAVSLASRDYTACLNAGCPHVEALQHSPIDRDCPAGHPVGRATVNDANMVLDVALSGLVGLIVNGGSPALSLQPLYVAVGTSTATTTASMTGCLAEAGRVAVASRYLGGQVGSYYRQAITSFFLGPNDCNVNIQELALMAGTATATANSGTAIARVLSAYGTKTSAQTITGVWTISGSGS